MLPILAVKSCQINPWLGHQGCKLRDKVQRLKDNVCGAIDVCSYFWKVCAKENFVKMLMPVTFFSPSTALGMMVLLLLPAVLMGHTGAGGLASDAVRFHLPQINEFRNTPLNLLEYNATATTLPLYHFVIGTFARIFGDTAVANNDLPWRLLHVFLSLFGPFLFFKNRSAIKFQQFLL